MINLNYLNHELYLINSCNTYKCKKCNIIIWYQDKDSEIFEKNFVDEQYLVYVINNYDEYDFNWSYTILKCDEYIIKNLIE